MKRLTSLILALLLLLMTGMLPVASAVSMNHADVKPEAYVFTEADNAAIETDVFASISQIEQSSAQTKGGIGHLKEQDYIKMLPQVIEAIESSETYKKGTLQQNGSFLVWQTTVGIPCCFDPRMEAELQGYNVNMTDAEIEEENRQNEMAVRGGTPTSTKIGIIQPYWDSSTNYDDSAFLNYSPDYKSMWQKLYTATGGTGMRYSMGNATIDNIAKTIEECGLVIFDSHGTTDYSGSNGDYTSRANCSYLCLSTNTGVTTADTTAKQGQFGTYYDVMKGTGYAYVSGTAIANHMTKNAPHSLLYMGICLGMATDGMFKGLRNRGVETVWGYSQSVTFSGERTYMNSILGYVKDGDQFKDAVKKTKDATCWWDPAYSGYTESGARNEKAAFPICVSSEDAYPGHGNVDKIQNVYSTWHLYGNGGGANYTVTATSNNTSYGTVSVNGNVITATPYSGYYASGYTVTSGTATVTQNGNTFTVNPSSNCTVRINFAAKTKVTITCKANGSTYTTLTPYSGETFTLPSSATSVSGYSFVGWSTSTVYETSSKPDYYAPGASVSATSNVTLYAVYTRTEGGSGANVYQLVTSTPSSWAGNYVITNGNSTSMYVLKGVTPSSNGAQIESSSNATAYSSTGMSLSGNTLSNVSNAYVFTLAANGSAYTVKSASTGSYLGLSSYYLAAYTTLNASYCNWTPAINASGAAQLKNAAGGSYPYLGFSSSSKYFWSASANNANVLRLWKATASGTTYYTTSPSSSGSTPTPTTSYTVSFSVPSGVSSVASQTVTANSYITLPTAGAPSGYTFLGWVTSAVSSTTVKPTVLTGSYKVTGNITLRALYSYTATSGSGSSYQLVSSTPASWDGNYVITYGTSSSSMYVLKGLSGNNRYESSTSNAAVLLSNTGMTLSNNTLSGATNPYIFKLAANGSKYTIQSASTGSYVASYSAYLSSRANLETNYCLWTLSCNNGNITATNSASGSYPYMSFATGSKYFMLSASAPTGLYFWKQTGSGSSTTYYTTG